LQDYNCRKLVEMLTESVKRNYADALLLSGGLDSSILASILRPEYTVAAGFGPDAPDFGYARKVAARYSKRHVELVIGQEKLLDIVENVIRLFRTFDPIEIRNSSVAFAAIEKAKQDGYRSIMTGDGGDELFAGYNFLQRYYDDLQALQTQLQRLWDVMHFSSAKIGAQLGVDIRTPFLDRSFAEFAKSLSPEVKVGSHLGERWGKFILRGCFEQKVGSEIAWRRKLAQEQGAATDRLQDLIGLAMSGSEFQAGSASAAKSGVRIRSKEHLYYFEIYRRYFPPPKEDGSCKLRCPDCGGCFESQGRFCRVCGAFPVTPVKSW